jgi:hypothetical protein
MTGKQYILVILIIAFMTPSCVLKKKYRPRNKPCDCPENKGKYGQQININTFNNFWGLYKYHFILENQSTT